MKRHYYAITCVSTGQDVALAFSSKKDRDVYIEERGGVAITNAEAKKYRYVSHHYAYENRNWLSQMYPKRLWW